MDNFVVNYIQQTIKNEAGQVFTGEQVLSVNERILISGVAGSGKTTLCQYLYNLTLEKSTNNIQSCLIYARDFNSLQKIDFQEFIENKIIKKNEKIENIFYIIIDGLDEINPNIYQEVASNISDFFSVNKKYSAILTSRPLVDFDYFHNFEKCKLQLPDIQNIIKNRIKPFFQKKEAFDFLDAVKANKLEIANPLLLTLSLNAFKSYGALPNNIYRTIELAIEQLLSSWDNSKNIYTRSNNSLGSNIEILSLFAYYLELNKKNTFSISDFHRVYQSETYNIRNTVNVFLYFEQSSIFVEEGFVEEGLPIYSFVHKSIQDYFLVKYFQDYCRIEHKLKNTLHFKPYILELIVESENIDAVNNYISHTDIDKSDIIYKTIDLFNRNDKKSKTQDLLVNGNKNTLKKEWEKLIKQQNSSQKGKQLECFCAELLSIQFKIIEKNLLTHNGEIDLIVENKSTDPFWSDFSTDYFVECKFWKEKVPIEKILAFFTKVSNSSIKLGFFISLSGFTKDALREFENIASKSLSPIIVPITQNEIIEYLSVNEIDSNEFFKKLVRKMKYKKKY